MARRPSASNSSASTTSSSEPPNIPCPPYTPSDTSSTAHTPTTPTTTKQRKRRPRRSNAAAAAPAPANTIPIPIPIPTPPNPASPDPLIDIFIHTFATIGSAVLSAITLLRDVVTSTFLILRTPLVVLLALYLVTVVAAYGLRALAMPLMRAVQPLCALPGVNLLDVPWCEYGNGGEGLKPTRTRGGAARTDFGALIQVQNSFEELLEKSVSGSGLAGEIKKSEFAVSDLKTLVRASSLGCRDELSTRLDDFLTAARATSKDLSRFGSAVTGVVDSVISIDNYALRTLSHARTLELAADGQNPIVALALAPFRSYSPLAVAEERVRTTFINAGNIMDTSLQQLVHRARGVLNDLERLEEKLRVVHEVVARENGVLRGEYDDVLQDLWTFLGGNREKLGRYESHLQLLADLTAYRASAAAHVRVSLVRLEKMQSDLEDLRGHVVKPAVLADAGMEETMPLEVHMETIRRGVRRLEDSMKRVEGGRVDDRMGIENLPVIVLEE